MLRTPRIDTTLFQYCWRTVLLLSCYLGYMVYHGYVGVQSRGVIALPAEVRRRMHLDEAGAQLELTERPDGVLELRPSLPVPAEQRWFWTQHWQERERAVDAHVAAGEVGVHEDANAFLEHLDQLGAESGGA